MRLAVVVAVVAAIALGRWVVHRWKAGLHTDDRAQPVVPGELLPAGAARTWLVFTTPYCATCGPVIDRLRADDPGTPVVAIDATDRPDLAQAFHVRSSPTVLLADAGGTVVTRLVGAQAVTAHLAATAA